MTTRAACARHDLSLVACRHRVRYAACAYARSRRARAHHRRLLWIAMCLHHLTPICSCWRFRARLATGVSRLCADRDVRHVCHVYRVASYLSQHITLSTSLAFARRRASTPRTSVGTKNIAYFCESRALMSCFVRVFSAPDARGARNGRSRRSSSAVLRSSFILRRRGRFRVYLLASFCRSSRRALSAPASSSPPRVHVARLARLLRRFFSSYFVLDLVNASRATTCMSRRFEEHAPRSRFLPTPPPTSQRLTSRYVEMVTLVVYSLNLTDDRRFASYARTSYLVNLYAYMSKLPSKHVYLV